MTGELQALVDLMNEAWRREQKKAERRKANKEAKARLRGFWRPGPRVQVLSVAVVEGMAERTKKQRRRKAKLQTQLAKRLAGVGQMPLERATDGNIVTLADAVSP